MREHIYGADRCKLVAPAIVATIARRQAADDDDSAPGDDVPELLRATGRASVDRP